MGYFDDPKNVDEYVKMAKGYDGREIIQILKKYLPEKSTLLELGMGPGVDLDILKNIYEVTGSDSSLTFIQRYLDLHKDEDVDLIQLDATALNTDRRWDAIYSNKVLIHLSKQQCIESFQNQVNLLKHNGIAFHSFWRGKKEEEMHGLLFVYYEMEDIEEIVSPYFEILEMNIYTEMEKNDSIYVVLRRK